jgi:hypothetical protein
VHVQFPNRNRRKIGPTNGLLPKNVASDQDELKQNVKIGDLRFSHTAEPTIFDDGANWFGKKLEVRKHVTIRVE